MKQPYFSRAGFIPVLILIVLGLLGGGVGVAVLADDAHSGDLLFPVDIFVEDLESLLKFGAEDEADFRAEVAEERISEVEDLLEEKGVDAPGLDIALGHVREALAKLEALFAEHPELRSQIENAEDALEDRLDAFEEERGDIEDIFEDEETVEPDDNAEPRADAEADIREVKDDFAELQADATRFGITLSAQAVASYQSELAQAEAAFAQGRYADVEALVDRVDEALEVLEGPVEQAKEQAGEVEDEADDEAGED